MIRRLANALDRPASPHRILLLQTLWVVLDLVLFVAVAGATSLLVDRPLRGLQWLIIGIMALIRIWAFVRLGMYRTILRYSGIHSLFTVVTGVGVGTLGIVVLCYFLNLKDTGGLGRLFLVPEALLAIFACGGTRLIARLFIERMHAPTGRTAFIYGAGKLGEATWRLMRQGGDYRVIGFLDDDPHLAGALIHGLRVRSGLDSIESLPASQRPDVLIIAIRDLPADALKRIFHQCMEWGITVRKAQVGVGSAGAQTLALADLQIEDLLRRPRRNLDPSAVRLVLAGATVAVTGAGGSIGSELCRQIAALGARRLVLIDHGEFNLYQIEAELRERHAAVDPVPVLDSCDDQERLTALLRSKGVRVVFHAAAYKHVPLVEENPCRGVANNVQAFRNVCAACDAAGVERLVLISTDKAVRPTNVMGASKRVCELIMQNAPTGPTRRCAVRFGNVLGSSGSVLPRFLAQIQAGGPVTVTHPDMTRFFMLIPEAVELVLQAAAMAEHGEVFILDMGQPVKISDLARQLIILSGRRPGDEVAITYTGLRPGEKLYEEILHDPSQAQTRIPDITIGPRTEVAWDGLRTEVEGLLEACRRQDQAALQGHLQAIVPEWLPSRRFRQEGPDDGAAAAAP